MKKMLLTSVLCLCASAVFLGCSSTNTQQIVNSASGDGVLAKLAVPTGQSTSIGASLFVGRFNASTVLQPTSTNGALNTPNLAVTVYGAGKQSVTGGTGVGTNATAGIADGSRDASFIITGGSTASVQTGTNTTVSVGK